MAELIRPHRLNCILTAGLLFTAIAQSGAAPKRAGDPAGRAKSGQAPVLQLDGSPAPACPQSERIASQALLQGALDAVSAAPVDIFWDESSCRPRQIHGSFGVIGVDAEVAARNFIVRHAELFHLAKNGADLELETTREGRAGSYLRFGQRLDGLPVFGGEVIVQLTGRGAGFEIRGVTLAQARFAQPPARQPAITAGDAVARARTAAGASAGEAETRLGYDSAEPPALVWRVRFSVADPAADWEAMIDAGDGRVRSLRDRIVHVNGSGFVFDPNAVASTGNTALTDNNDATNAALDAARFTMTLPRLDGSTFLRGSYADARPSNAASRAASATEVFNYNRTDDHFEEVMAYFHIDRVQNRIQTALGYTGVNNRQQVMIVNGTTADNSFYSSATQTITTGSGGVDDAEDADVLVHEYGHSIQDNQVPGFGGGDEGAMGEGFGDYLAGSMENVLTAQAGHAEVTVPECVADWDAVSYSSGSPPCLRRLDGTKHYPEFADGEVHDDGEIWSAALWRARTTMGANTMDTDVIESHFSLSTSETFASAANAVIAADIALFGGANVTTLRKSFIEQGLSRQLTAASTLPDVLSSAAVSIDNPRTGGVYANLLDHSQTYTFPGAAGIRVHFSQFDTELDAGCFAGACDNVYLYDAAGNLFQILSGTLAAFDSVKIPGNFVRIRLVSDNSVAKFGYHVDRIDRLGVSAVNPVPDGSVAATQPMRAAKAGAAVNVTWDVATCPAPGYNLYWGALGNFNAITGGACALGNSGSALSLPIPGNSWWVMAGASGAQISSFGRNSSGLDETFTGWGAAGVCPAQTTQSTASSCHP